MDGGVEAPRFRIGVQRVPRAKEIDRIFCRRLMPPLGVIFVVSAVMLLAAPRAHAQSEDQIKAAFLFNFARYVEWPEDAFDRADAPVVICTLGANGFTDVLFEIVSGKEVGERSVEVRRPSDLSQSVGCHILFVGRRYDGPHEELIGALQNRSVFTVSDREGFAAAGGTANFLRADNRIRFEINPRAARDARLKISSRLLRLARIVDQASP